MANMCALISCFISYNPIVDEHLKLRFSTAKTCLKLFLVEMFYGYKPNTKP